MSATPEEAEAPAHEQHFRRSLKAISQALQEVSEAASAAAAGLAEEPAGASPEGQRLARAVLTSIYARYAFLEQLAGSVPGGEPARPLVPRAPSTPLPRSTPRQTWQRAVAATSACQRLAARGKAHAAEAGQRQPEGGLPAFSPPPRGGAAAPADAEEGFEEQPSLAEVSERRPKAGLARSTAGLRVRRSVELAFQAVESALASMDSTAAAAVPGETGESEAAAGDAASEPSEDGEGEGGSQEGEDEDSEDPAMTMPKRRGARAFTIMIGEVEDSASYLRLLRRCFESCDFAGEGCLSVPELARSWAAATCSSSGRPLGQEEHALIAADVQRFFALADVFRCGRVRMDDWLHYALLEAHPPGQADLVAIAEQLKSLDDHDFLSETLRIWEVADPEGTGFAPRESVSRALLLSGSADVDSPECLGADPSSPGVSYAEFCAYQLGLQFEAVELLYYDLSRQVGKYLSPLLLWRLEEGIWHTGVVVYGKEYYYYGSICRSDPGDTPFGKPTKSRRLGATLRTTQDFHAHIMMELNQKFDYESYDVLANNCNHCCDALVRFLLGRHVPDQVRFLPDRVMGTPIAKMLRPLLNKWLRGSEKPRQSEGEVLKAAWSGKKKAALRRGRVLEDVSVTFYMAGGGAVLYEAPGASRPLVAQVTSKSLDGETADIAWLDSNGRWRVKQGVRTALLKPYMEKAAGTVASVYAAALEALSGPEAEAEVARRAASSEARACLTLREFVSAPVLLCPKGHSLVQAKDGFIRALRSRKCDECGRGIPRGECHMTCAAGCRHSVCQGCWEGSAGGLRALLRSGGVARCPRGHLFERLFGQGVRGEAACKKCGTRELGAVFPFFLSCQLCQYDVCPHCAS